MASREDGVCVCVVRCLTNEDWKRSKECSEDSCWVYYPIVTEAMVVKDKYFDHLSNCMWTHRTVLLYPGMPASKFRECFLNLQ